MKYNTSDYVNHLTKINGDNEVVQDFLTLEDKVIAENILKSPLFTIEHLFQIIALYNRDVLNKISIVYNKCEKEFRLSIVEETLKKITEGWFKSTVVNYFSLLVYLYDLECFKNDIKSNNKCQNEIKELVSTGVDVLRDILPKNITTTKEFYFIQKLYIATIPSESFFNDFEMEE